MFNLPLLWAVFPSMVREVRDEGLIFTVLCIPIGFERLGNALFMNVHIVSSVSNEAMIKKINLQP